MVLYEIVSRKKIEMKEWLASDFCLESGTRRVSETIATKFRWAYPKRIHSLKFKYWVLLANDMLLESWTVLVACYHYTSCSKFLNQYYEE